MARQYYLPDFELLVMQRLQPDKESNHAEYYYTYNNYLDFRFYTLSQTHIFGLVHYSSTLLHLAYCFTT